MLFDLQVVTFPQSGNFAIFLPFLFYVKSILADFRRSKVAILIILEALNIEFFQNSKFIAAKMVKMAIFGASKCPKMILGII